MQTAHTLHRSLRTARKSRLRPVALAAGALMLAGASHGASVSWINPAGGYWDATGNWSSAALPGAADSVSILALPGAVVEHRSGTTTIDSFSSNARLALTGGSLSFASASSINADSTLSGPYTVLGGAGALTVGSGSTMIWQGGTQSGSGSTTIASGSALNVTGSVSLTQRTLNNSGALTIAGNLNNNGTINNAAGKTLQLQDNGSFNIYTGGTINNAGTLLKTGANSTSGIYGSFNNTGVVDAQGGVLTINGTHRLDGGSYQSSAGGKVVLIGGTHTVDTHATIAAGTTELTGAYTVLTGKGNLDVAAGGTLNWSAGTQSGSGSTTVASGATLNQTGSTALTQRVIHNQGTLAVNGNLNNTNGTINNAAGGTLLLQDSGSFNIYSGGTVDNAGTLLKAGNNSTSGVYGSLNNTGLVNVQSGNLGINGSFNNTGGQVKVGAGNVLAINATHTLGGGSYDASNATLALTGGTHNVNADTSITAQTLQLTGPYTVLTGTRALTLTQGTTMDWSAGTQSGSGSTVIASGAALNVTGNATLSQRTIQNNGALTITGNLNNSNGTIHNVAGQTLLLQDNGSFNVYSGGTLNNAGTLVKAGSNTTSGLYGSFNNTGVVDAQSGVLTINGTHRLDGGTYQSGAGGKVVFIGGTHTVDTHATIAAGTTELTGAYTVLGGKGTLDVAAGSTLNWSAGTQSGSGSTVVASGATLNQTGSTTLAQRTLHNNGALNVSGVMNNNDGVINNASTGTLLLQDNSGFGVYSSGTLNNAGTLIKTGANTTSGIYGTFNNTGLVDVQSGTLTLGNAHTNAGHEHVAANATLQMSGGSSKLTNAGVISGDGTVAASPAGLANNGELDPGTAGTVGHLSITGNLTDSKSAVLRIDLAGANSFDSLAVSGTALLGGTLDIWNAGLVPQIGQSFQIATFGQRNGTVFDNVNWHGFGSGFALDVLYRDHDVLLSVQAVPEPETYALLLAGLGIVGWVSRRKQLRD